MSAGVAGQSSSDSTDATLFLPSARRVAVVAAELYLSATLVLSFIEERDLQEGSDPNVDNGIDYLRLMKAFWLPLLLTVIISFAHCVPLVRSYTKCFHPDFSNRNVFRGKLLLMVVTAAWFWSDDTYMPRQEIQLVVNAVFLLANLALLWLEYHQWISFDTGHSENLHYSDYNQRTWIDHMFGKKRNRILCFEMQQIARFVYASLTYLVMGCIALEYFEEKDKNDWDTRTEMDLVATIVALLVAFFGLLVAFGTVYLPVLHDLLKYGLRRGKWKVQRFKRIVNSGGLVFAVSTFVCLYLFLPSRLQMVTGASLLMNTISAICEAIIAVDIVLQDREVKVLKQEKEENSTDNDIQVQSAAAAY